MKDKYNNIIIIFILSMYVH